MIVSWLDRHCRFVSNIEVDRVYHGCCVTHCGYRQLIVDNNLITSVTGHFAYRTLCLLDISPTGHFA